MDLRSKQISAGQMERLRRALISRKLGYQAFLLSDDLKVGPWRQLHRQDPQPSAVLVTP